LASVIKTNHFDTQNG